MTTKKQPKDVTMVEASFHVASFALAIDDYTKTAKETTKS